MEVTEAHCCGKCGQTFSDSGLFASHPCSDKLTAPCRTKKAESYKCSQCRERFSTPGVLKRHFRSIHSGRDPRGPFACTKPSCQFSSTVREEYQAHLTSFHGLTLIPCTVRSCRVSLCTQAEIDNHLRSHKPFGCFHCQFVTQNVKDLKRHISEHNHPPSNTQGQEVAATTVNSEESQQPQVSRRPKRNLISSPGSMSSLPEGANKEQTEGRSGKRLKKAVERDKPSEVDAAQLPSKEYLAEGAEHIYRTHTCPKCRRCFKMRSHLQEHLHLHFPDPGLQCPTCKRYFTSKSKLRVHRLREAGKKLHHCHLCEYSAVERNAVQRHLVSVHPEEAGGGSRSYPCPSCAQSFHQSRLLKAHMKTHNLPWDSEPLACFQEGCSFQSSSRKELLRHSARVHGVKAAECRHHACGLVFPSETDMEAHYRSHQAYHCSQCRFSCSNKSVFQQHQRHGHPGAEQLRCDFCAFVTFNPVEYEQHVGHMHASEKIHRCSQCSYVTSHKRGLTRHMLMHSGEKPHKCNLCDFRCRDESYLSKHMLTHSDDKNFMCAECGYVTKWKHYLNVHMRKHAGDLRYQCDQCPYRCHRMDQLNSHKLRHQTKSLMCEICAYACKRKYELRSHMLAKHSGVDKQPSVHKCKYCAYTTSYRQALKNHENCKHTKLREFHCALCSYSCFSSISLFLHKRKAHGYVPGDKAWLENYATKEKERNSTEFLQDFYNKPSTSHGGVGQSGADPGPSDLPSSEDQRKEAEAGSQVGVFHVVSQEVVPEAASDNPPAEEYCTLVLTTLSTTDYQTSSEQNEEENCANQTSRSPNLHSNGSDMSGEQTNRCVSPSEKPDTTAADAECEQSDLDDNFEPLSNSSQTVEHLTPVPTPIISSQSPLVESERRLQAMKQHDREQAEAMVLEGRVQMLVVPAAELHHCNKCSYVTSKDTALEHHRQALCHGRMKGHACQACGAQFKQRRGLESHLAKKCPALRTIKTGILTKTCSTAEDEELDEEANPNESEFQASPDRICTDSTDQEMHQQTAERSDLSNCEGFVPATESEHQVNKSQTEKLLRDAPVKEQFVPLQEENGKFSCKLCNFSSVRLAVVERHLLSCRVTSGEQEDQAISDMDGSDSHQTLSPCRDSKLKHKTKTSCLKPDEIHCTMCSFQAKTRMALTRHSLRVHSKEKPDVARSRSRLQCQQCSFTCRQQRCLTKHVLLQHAGARPHRCRYCAFSTARRYRLHAHESLHTGLGRHGCAACGKTFGAASKLRQHKIRTHDKRPAHFCPLCDFSGYAQDDVRRHRLRCHSGEMSHTCTHCDAGFSSEVALRNHCKRIHRLQVGFSCKQCEFTCGSEEALKSHLESRHQQQQQLRCSTCLEVFSTRENLALHQRTHQPHQCQLCPFASKTRQLLAQHLLSEHEGGAPEEKPLRCSSCSFACRHQLVLEQHLRSHGGKRVYKCSECDYSTRNKQKITWHIRIHTGEKPYSCEQCSYTCTDPSRLKLHMRVHQEEKKYLCPQCGYKCKWATQLKYHMTKHTGDKPYACDECEYRTNRADTLRAHRDTQHCDARPYVCEKCGKAFKTGFILKTHQRQHSEERAYACGVCNKTFRWPAGLRHHFLSHTKQQPFGCRHCSYRAKQRFQVVKHLQRHHPEVSAEQGVVRDAKAGGLTLKEALEGALEGKEMEEQEEAGQRGEDQKVQKM